MSVIKEYTWKVNFPDYDDDEFSEFESFRFDGTSDLDFNWVAELYAEQVCNNDCGYYSDFVRGAKLRVVSPQGIEKTIKVAVEYEPSFSGIEVK